MMTIFNKKIPRGKWENRSIRLDGFKYRLIDAIIAYKIEIGDYYGAARGKKQEALNHAFDFGFESTVVNFFGLNESEYISIHEDLLNSK